MISIYDFSVFLENYIAYIADNILQKNK